MDDPTLPLPGLSPVAGRSVKACFDGGTLSSDAGVLVLREVEKHLGAAERLAQCLDDPRASALITRSLAGIVRFRVLMIAAGCQDGNDATILRPGQGDGEQGRSDQRPSRFAEAKALDDLGLQNSGGLVRDGCRNADGHSALLLR